MTSTMTLSTDTSFAAERTPIDLEFGAQLFTIDPRFGDAECVNDILVAVATAKYGEAKRMARDADIPEGTFRSYLVKKDDGSYKRAPDAERLVRLMAVRADVRAGIFTLIQKQQPECGNRSPII